ncbi:MAG TPA: DUF2283 domain-containing protein [Candidatus Kapabacteria bacterium]|nr:DUF2283 domain-containing protein [Candidatus Kapabacteria bacterium]
MKVTYDQEVDILNIELSETEIEESDEDKPGVILDYDADGNIVSIEILDASKRIRNPRAVEMAVVG